MPRRGLESGVALAGYAVLSFAYFGVRLFFQQGHALVGFGYDPQIFYWAFAWWPHAIGHGENPLVTHAIWAPDGLDLAWTASVPGLALAFAPLTIAAGAAASYDTAAVLMPALAAWTAFLLCRHVTRMFWPSLAGGYLFGFSSYMLGQTQGHLQLTSVFLLPLVALVVLRHLEGELGARGLALRLGVLIAAELTFSTEITFTMTLALLCTLVLAYATAPAARHRLRSIPLPLLGAYAVAAVLTSPLLYYALTDFHSGAINTGSPTIFTSDLLNFLVPTDLVVSGRGWTHAITQHFTGNRSEQVAYLGLPTIVILAWFGWRRWRTAAGRFLLAAITVALVASFGSWLHVDGRQVITLPWEHIGYLPVFDNILPGRLVLYVTLGAAVAVAMWAASREAPRWTRIALPALAALALVPNVSSAGLWRITIHDPAFIRGHLYEGCLRRGENVLVLPFPRHGDSMVWQADAGFWYRMAAGYVAPKPPVSFQHPPAVAHLAYGIVPTHAGPLRQYVRLKHVSVIVVDQARADPWPSLLRGFAKPKAVGGVLVYRLDGSPPCTSA